MPAPENITAAYARIVDLETTLDRYEGTLARCAELAAFLEARVSELERKIVLMQEWIEVSHPAHSVELRAAIDGDPPRDIIPE